MDAMRAIWLAATVLFTAACQTPTVFTGEPHYPGGPGACQRNCQAGGMEMSAFVYSGEFASSCVCRVRRGAAPAPSQPSPAPAAPAPRSQLAEPDAAADDEAEEIAQAAAAGVVEQMRRAAQDQERQRQMNQHQWHGPAGGPTHHPAP